MPVQFITPLGRLVQGMPLKPYTTDQQGKPLTVKTGPNAGQPAKSYSISVAFPKVYPPEHPQAGQPNAEWAELYGKLYAEGRAAFPNLFNAQGQCTHPRFTMKIMDGDGVDNNGVDNKTKAGFAGHWILKLKSGFPPECMTDKGVPLVNESDIKTGYYVQVVGSASSNAPSEVPGLYVNLSGVILKFIGPVISSGPDVAALAAQSAAAGGGYVPAGASAVPIGGGLAPALGAVPHMAVAGPLPGLPGLPGAAAPMPAAGALPGLPGAALPVAGGLPGLPGALPVATPATLPPVYVDGPNMPPGHTRTSLNAAGHSDDLLLQHGYIVKQAPPPNPGFVANAGLPVAGALPGAAAALPGLPGLGGPPPGLPVAAPVYGPGPKMPPGYTRERLNQEGHTDDVLLQAGYIVRVA